MHLQRPLAHEIAPECSERAARWHRLLPRCVLGLEETSFNDSHKVQEEYDIVTWAHRIAIMARRIKNSES